MRHDLNSAANAIAAALNASIGIRRTYGGADDCNRMHISWQILRNSQVIGMIDLICQDGLGQDGMEWHGSVRITAPGIDYEEQLLTPWHKLHGRKAKRVTRQKFFNDVDRIIKKAIHGPLFLQNSRRNNPPSVQRLRANYRSVRS